MTLSVELDSKKKKVLMLHHFEKCNPIIFYTSQELKNLSSLHLFPIHNLFQKLEIKKNAQLKICLFLSLRIHIL